MNVFQQSRRQLTLYYSLIMAAFLVVLIFFVHQSMEWSMESEQARELVETAGRIAGGQEYLLQHPELLEDAEDWRMGESDRLFFYVFDTEGEPVNFSRASTQLEPFVMDIISAWDKEPGEVAVVSDQGRRRHVRVMMTAQPMMEDGEQIAVVYVGKDVTAMYNGLQKATYSLAALAVLALAVAAGVGHFLAGKAIVPLIEAYEKQRQFAADASHELRTPLSVVMASADLLENDPSITSPFLKQVIADVRDEVKKMTKLVSDLLFVARSDNQALKVKRSKVDLAAFADQTIRLMQPLADKKKISLLREGEESLTAKLDEQKMKQLLLILVDNAVKYTLESGKVTVRILAPAAGKIRIEVEDTGIGISKEDKEKIFDRFFRVDKARSREMGGNGLGLAIAQEIVSLHGGKINVESELGKGTKFIVTLKGEK
ncbi:MAG: sensor histidine kinase [Schwartzia sp.]|nr:sensor histidine kinase [Schwartzia sp. (in: firmicutes)]MBP3691258.1 sensor histidine kinase [Schwartzia sp. (in: firmicutes)]